MQQESALFIRYEDGDPAIDLTDKVDLKGIQLTKKTKLEVRLFGAYQQAGRYYLDIILNRDIIFPFGYPPGSRGYLIRGNDLHYIKWKKPLVYLAVKFLRKCGSIKLLLEPQDIPIYDNEVGMYTGRRADEFWDSETGLFQLTAETVFDGMKIRHVIWEEPDDLWHDSISFPLISRVARIADKYPAEAAKMRERQRKMKREENS